MKIKFDRQDYLALEEIFEVGQLDDVTLELSEFSDDIEDMAYELAYTRYELAKAEARHNALVEAVAWERECGTVRFTDLWFDEWNRTEDQSKSAMQELRFTSHAARAEVDRLIASEQPSNYQEPPC